MSYRASLFHKRLNFVERVIRPENSLAWKIANLSPKDREAYELFRAETAKWSEKFEGEELYIHLLAAVEGAESDMPKLPKRLELQLYPPSKFTHPYDIYEEEKGRIR